MSMSTLCRFTLAGKCWKSADAVGDPSRALGEGCPDVVHRWQQTHVSCFSHHVKTTRETKNPVARLLFPRTA